jgi:uncharacterized FlaG/YvyC family protein
MVESDEDQERMSEMQIQRDVLTPMVDTNATSMAKSIQSEALKTATVQAEGQPFSKQDQQQSGPRHEEVQRSVDLLQKQLTRMRDTSFQLEFDKEIDKVIVKFTSRETGEIVRQIPSEKFVNFEKEFVRTIGLLFDIKL